MFNGAHDTYLESRVLSADPLELVRLLYQAALGAVGDARRFLGEGRIAERSRAISKATAIVMELGASLDRERGGEISSRLGALYEYIVHRLFDANLKQSDEALAEVSSLLATLSEGWAGIQTPAQAEAADANVWEVPEATAACAARAWSV